MTAIFELRFFLSCCNAFLGHVPETCLFALAFGLRTSQRTIRGREDLKHMINVSETHRAF